MIWSYILDGVLCLLLIGALLGGVRLNQRLTILRQGQSELRLLITQLHEAAERAQASVVQLRSAAKESEATLTERATKARALADELQILTESGESIALRIERGANAMLNQKLDAPSRASAPATPSKEATQLAKEAAMLKLLKGVR
jgi:hypothetical protein